MPLTGTWVEGVETHTFNPTLDLAVGKSMYSFGTLPVMANDSTVVHLDTVQVGGVGTISGTPVIDESTFKVNPPSPEVLPTPTINLEKGILFPLVDGVTARIRPTSRIRSNAASTQAQPFSRAERRPRSRSG